MGFMGFTGIVGSKAIKGVFTVPKRGHTWIYGIALMFKQLPTSFPRRRMRLLAFKREARSRRQLNPTKP